MFVLGKEFFRFLTAYRSVCIAIILLTVSSALPIFCQSPAPEPIRLEIQKPLERSMSGGQVESFRVELPAGQNVKVLVRQLGIDVMVRLLGSDGKPAIDIDADPRSQGEETLEFTSKAAGIYQITVASRRKSAPQGSYEISIAEIRSASEKDIDLDEARRLSTEANRLYFASEPDAALPLVERLVAIREKQLGPDHPDYGQALFLQANILTDKGDYSRAESLYERSRAIREKALGKDHISMASLLNNYGLLEKQKGDFVKAEQFFRGAVAIREKVLDPDHPLLASSLNNLATVLSARGDKTSAKEIYQRVLAIQERSLGPESAEVSNVLTNIANLYSDVPSAEPYYRRVLAIREKVYGPDNVEVAQTLYNFAVLYSTAGDYAKAEPICQRALSIFEKKLGEGHPYVSYVLNLMAVNAKDSGDYPKAESLYQRAIAIKEKTQPFHPDLGGSLANLANLFSLKGDMDKAVEYQTRAIDNLEHNIALNLSTGSEKDKLDYLDMFSTMQDQTLTLNFQAAPKSRAAAELGFTTLLRYKARVLDSMSDSFGALRRRFNKDDQKLLDDFNTTTTALVGMVLDGPGDKPIDDYKKAVNDLEERRNDLESKISSESSGAYEKAAPVTLKSIQGVIPRGAALVEFVVYRPVSAKSFEFGDDRPDAYGAPRYAVYVLGSNTELKWRDLGDAKKIDGMIDAFRASLRDSSRKDTDQLARSLDEAFARPVRSLAGGATHLLVSPDGELNLMPFEALLDESGKYLIERYQFTYLTSGRDLLRMQTARESKQPPLLIADPAFGEPGQNVADSRASSAVKRGQSSITTTRNLSDTFFGPLSGTAEEGRRIHELFPESKLLTGAQATETALKSTSSPKIVHLATHGFFLEDRATGKTAARITASTNAIQNPLLRSGLAFAGANRHQTQGDDGILTALEASGLDLWGTKLVVLSACDTGLGQVRNGEGVYGLRRAFVLAGAESLVMSLWPVSDFVTRELMVGYYQYLKQGIGRGAALRQVQLDMLKRPNRKHPFYWASFIQSGEWANLDGKR